MSSIFRSDEEYEFDFDNLVGHSRGGISNENMKHHYKIELEQLKTYLTSNAPIKELRKFTIKYVCAHFRRQRRTR